MKTVQAKILAFSDDKEFMKSFGAKPGSDRVSKDSMMKYRVVSSTSQIKSLQNADLVIYDIDMASGNFERITEDILHLKLNARTKPLVLLGSREGLDDVLRSTKLRPLIARAEPKPILKSKLRLVLETTLPEETALPAAKRPSLARLLAYGSASLASIVAMVVFVSFSNANLGSNERPNDIESVLHVEEASEQLIEISAVGVKKLNQKATRALEQGRVAFPANDNALHYFDEILKIDLYHADAYTGRQQILKQLKASLPELLQARKLVHARDVIEVLIKAEPFSDDNRRMIIALHDAGGVYRVNDSVNDLVSEAKPESTSAGKVSASKALASDTLSKAEVAAKREQQWLKKITKAIDLDNLAPPNAGNAYTLLRNAVARQEIGGDNLHTVKQQLAAGFVEQIEQNIEKSKLVKAAKLSKLLRRVDGQNPKLRDLVRQIEEGQSQLYVANKNSIPGKQVASLEKPSLRTAPAPKLKPAELVKRVSPKYPQLALNGNVEGWVEVSYQVNEFGKVVNATIVDAEPKRVFNKPSLRAINKWRFEPAKDLETGEAIMSEVKNTTRFSFNL